MARQEYFHDLPGPLSVNNLVVGFFCQTYYQPTYIRTPASIILMCGVSFMAFMAVMFQVEVFWVVTLCSVVVGTTTLHSTTTQKTLT